MSELGWQAWLTAGVIVTMIVALVREVARPDLILVGSLGLLLLAGVVSPEQAFSGFANTAVLTVGALFVVAAGVQRTQALSSLDRILFAVGNAPNSHSVLLRRSLPRIMLCTSVLSAFLNNTPIVAMLTPRLQQWADKTGVASSKLLIPLSYAAIVGGMMTLIGTSTNIVVSGLLQASGYEGLGMFDLTWVGAPAALGVLLYLSIGGHRLLPDRRREGDDFGDGLKDCLFEARVATESPLIGQSIEEAGLRALGGVYLAHVRRDGRLIPATPEEVLQERDVLTFLGTASSMEALLQRPGLDRAIPAIDENDYQTMPLYEAVVADSSDLVSKTLRESNFREEYGGVVLAIQRKNERVEGPLGRIPIKAGDLLLVEARNGFDKRWNENRNEFYLVASRRPQTVKPQARKAPLALLILVGMVVLAATGTLPLVTAAIAAALAMILTRCLRGAEARQSVDIQVLVVIAAALGLGEAVQQTGLASSFAQGIISLTDGFGPLVVLAAIYLTTNLLTELITNNAAAVLMLPVAIAVAIELAIEPMAFAVAVAIASSASFLTPIGYQTNLMVMAAGGYRYKDYFTAGLPASIIVMVTTIAMIRLVWM